MFKSLHSKFILITMSLVGLVLLAVLGASFYSFWRAAHEEVDHSLEIALSEDVVPQIGIGHARDVRADTAGNPPADEKMQKRIHIPVLVINVANEDQDIVLDNGSNFIEIDEDDIEDVVDDVFESTQNTGTIVEAHITWRRQSTANGWRIAVADIESMNESLKRQAISDIGVFAIAMLALFFITRFLATWALTPVRDAWEAQKRFIADASHELKTPLAVILANSEILSSKEGRIDEDSMRWIRSTADEAHHMHNLVEDLLQLARADETQTSLGSNTRTTIDFSALVDKIALQFDAVAFELGCEIESQLSPNLHIEGDRTQIERLVSILIDNSCKYAKKGTQVHLNLSSERSKVKLEVANEGDPIPEEDLPHVFDRFWRSDTARTREETGGYGLGLAIAKAIVDAHTGEISVSSSQEAGTTFTVLLPSATL